MLSNNGFLILLAKIALLLLLNHNSNLNIQSEVREKTPHYHHVWLGFISIKGNPVIAVFTCMGKQKLNVDKCKQRLQNGAQDTVYGGSH